MATCPGCNGLLKKTPQRKTKCPHCGGFIFAKRRPGELEKNLVMEEAARAIDNEWENHYEFEKRCNMLSSVAVNSNQLSEAVDHYAPQVGPESAINMAYISLLRDVISRQNSNVSHKKRACYMLAEYHSEIGMDFRSFLRNSKIYELEEVTFGGTRRFYKIYPWAPDRDRRQCRVAQQFDKNKIYDTNSPTDQDLLPPEDCDCPGPGDSIGFCRCNYVPVLRHELPDELKLLTRQTGSVEPPKKKFADRIKAFFT